MHLHQGINWLTTHKSYALRFVISLSLYIWLDILYLPFQCFNFSSLLTFSPFEIIKLKPSQPSSWLPEGNPTVRITHPHSQAASRATCSQYFKCLMCPLKYFCKDGSLTFSRPCQGASCLAPFGGSHGEPCSQQHRWGISTSPLCSRQVLAGP